MSLHSEISRLKSKSDLEGLDKQLNKYEYFLSIFDLIKKPENYYNLINEINNEYSKLSDEDNKNDIEELENNLVNNGMKIHNMTKYKNLLEDDIAEMTKNQEANKQTISNNKLILKSCINVIERETDNKINPLLDDLRDLRNQNRQSLKEYTKKATAITLKYLKKDLSNGENACKLVTLEEMIKYKISDYNKLKSLIKEVNDVTIPAPKTEISIDDIKEYNKEFAELYDNTNNDYSTK